MTAASVTWLYELTRMERTDELITPKSGLGLFAEVVRTLGVPVKIREAFPRPGSNRG